MARGVVISIFLSLLFAENVWSQLPNTGATISGTVRDPSGSVVAEVQVTLRSADGIDLSEARTDNEGVFRFSGVSPGRYILYLEQPSFRLINLPFEVGRRSPPHIVVTFALATLESEVTVSPNDASVSDPSSNRDAITMNTQMLSNLPVLDEDYVAILSNLLDQAAVGTSGPSVIVDGMEVKNATISQSAIEEVRINDDPYSVEFWRPGKGRIEIITKSEGDQFHGSLGVVFRDAIFDARNTFATSRPPEQKRNYDVFLSGPIRKKKDAFFLSLTRNEDDLRSFVHAIDSTGTIQQSVPNPLRWTRSSLRLSHEASKSHRLSLQYSVLGYGNENYGVGGVILREAGTDYSIRLNNLTFSDQLTLSANKVNQLQVRIEKYRTATTSSSEDPKIIVEGAFTSGGAQVTQAGTQSSVALNDTLSWTKGRNQLKFGVNIPGLSRNFLDDRSNFGGTYYFSDIGSYQANLPYLLRWQAGDPLLHFGFQEIAGFAQDQIRVTPRLSVTLGLRYDWQPYFPAGTDFAPRASVARALDKKSKYVLRVGAGIFYDRTGPLPIADLLRYNGTRLREYSMLNPTFTGTLPITSAASVPSNIVVLAPNARIPYGVHYSLGIEHQLQSHTTMAITYRGSRSFHLFRSIDINAPPPPDYLARPDASFGIVRQIQSEGRQGNDGFDLTFRGNLIKYFTGQAQYTLSWTKNDTSGIVYFPSNNYDLSREWARADSDQRHRLNLTGTAQAKNWFTLGVTLLLTSGKPYTITTGTDTYNDGMDNARPPGLSRNSMQGRGYASFDLRLSHDFHLKPTDKQGPVLTTVIDAFNILNHTNYHTYVGVLVSPLFGKPVTAYPPRRLQMTVRLKF